MDLSKVKLVVTDMDGTLLNSNHEVSDLFFELFKKLQKHDIHFVAASGRPHYSIIEKLNPIKDDIIIVAENGGIVSKNDTILLSIPIKKNHLHNIEKIVNSNSQIHPIYCTKSKAYFKNASHGYIPLLSEYYPNFCVIDSVEAITEDIIKIALFHHEDSEKFIFPHFQDLASTYKIILSGKHWVDISDDSANKGYALNLIQKTYHINQEETMAFGDYNNDLEMLKLADYSFAMENAHPNVKNIANFETKSNDEFGVELILKKLIEAKNGFLD
ncbi:MAG: HAD family hydrolase [Flavobacteriales bacterium]|nr:HAD family hydrolase [Flavobacteriia bacterium]NCP05769.1 HAD family hydrolase [Flavobacteriales bacterium]PIV93610.1 MAG: Cof-type HAD-IIB family hydrolase [Flavobacteriaceae bacterium CG17_big_fil_post_rev_8_21_14_2_50_33_15]PIY13044.1 MAG: Cof-type HAD-IIB family hydrolase [Flavobacteriaceae bacterium CG_4_10_14_3_um_filter_33_47]PJB16705.1 MAG: Cof-type HAD-IIB family hydrolase [Flavobacteriaceae bacterium CG_4_9_14_3_um_filter_33_16]